MVEVAAGLHRASVPVTDSSVVWSAGRVVVRHYPGGAGTPVLVVHSLVTRSWVLDLAPGRSLIGALIGRGRDVYLLDWGVPGAAEAGHGFDVYAETLLAAEEAVREHSGRAEVHLVGYCLGGTLAITAHAALGDSRLASLTAIAPLVDTAAAGRLGGILRSRWLMPVLTLDGRGLVPASLVRESFHWLRPVALRTARQTWRRRRNQKWRSVAGPLSRWVWEQTPVPGALLFDLVDYVRGNGLKDGSWTVLGRPARIGSLDVPVLVAVTADDHIVPPSASFALVEGLVRPPQVVRCAGGHVAMLTGMTLPRRLSDFLTAVEESR
ncbi:alpha/beta fold hydrolase [Glycomyces sp. MUSA5-2]|uniref:alpha/beta fold hydrolase n=1 Tax=Glycomyces sp. MUSA5-2 TaxID=2053002 RepID=UPI00300A5EA0